MCLGILNFTKKYSYAALEECCRQAILQGKQKYTFIKNTIPVIAEDLGRAGYIEPTKSNDTRRGGFVMSSEATDLNSLLSRSQKLADAQRKEAQDDVDW